MSIVHTLKHSECRAHNEMQLSKWNTVVATAPRPHKHTWTLLNNEFGTGPLFKLSKLTCLTGQWGYNWMPVGISLEVANCFLNAMLTVEHPRHLLLQYLPCLTILQFFRENNVCKSFYSIPFKWLGWPPHYVKSLSKIISSHKISFHEKSVFDFWLL